MSLSRLLVVLKPPAFTLGVMRERALSSTSWAVVSFSVCGGWGSSLGRMLGTSSTLNLGCQRVSLSSGTTKAGFSDARKTCRTEQRHHITTQFFSYGSLLFHSDPVKLDLRESCINSANLMVSLHNFNQVLMKNAPPLQQTSRRQDGPGAICFCSKPKAQVKKRLIYATQVDFKSRQYEVVTFFDDGLHSELVGGFLHCRAESRDVFLLS